jgi:hypothetical protein
MISSEKFWIGLAVGFVGCHLLKGGHHHKMRGHHHG